MLPTVRAGNDAYFVTKCIRIYDNRTRSYPDDYTANILKNVRKGMPEDVETHISQYLSEIDPQSPPGTDFYLLLTRPHGSSKNDRDLRSTAEKYLPSNIVFGLLVEGIQPDAELFMHTNYGPSKLEIDLDEGRPFKPDLLTDDHQTEISINTNVTVYNRIEPKLIDIPDIPAVTRMTARFYYPIQLEYRGHLGELGSDTARRLSGELKDLITASWNKSVASMRRDFKHSVSFQLKMHKAELHSHFESLVSEEHHFVTEESPVSQAIITRTNADLPSLKFTLDMTYFDFTIDVHRSQDYTYVSHRTLSA